MKTINKIRNLENRETSETFIMVPKKGRYQFSGTKEKTAMMIDYLVKSEAIPPFQTPNDLPSVGTYLGFSISSILMAYRLPAADGLSRSVADSSG
jgi:hypothetical protein